MAEQNIDMIPLFYGACARLFVARKLERDHPDKAATGKQINEWSERLLRALEQEWDKIKKEL